jgi:hypothetical protein
MILGRDFPIRIPSLLIDEKNFTYLPTRIFEAGGRPQGMGIKNEGVYPHSSSADDTDNADY